MKKLNIIIYSLTALCCIGFLTACVASIDTSTPSISLNPSLKDCPIRFKKKDVYRLDIDSKIEFVIPKGVTYKTYYERDEKFYSNDFPTEVGTYSFIIETNANKYYKATKKWKVFNLVSATTNAKVKSFFNIGTDTWGGSNGSSVICKANCVSQNDDYTELSLNDGFSGCLDSKFDMFDGRFKIDFKTNLKSYGTFAFWLTGVSSGENTTDEITVELLANNKAYFGSTGTDKKYNVEIKTLSINYADEKWHTLEIYYNHSNPSAYVKLDNITIYEFDSAKIPTVEYVKPHIGLLYPQNPTWTGTWKSNVSNYARVGNYEAYKVNGDSQ